MEPHVHDFSADSSAMSRFTVDDLLMLAHMVKFTTVGLNHWQQHNLRCSRAQTGPKKQGSEPFLEMRQYTSVQRYETVETNPNPSV